MRSGPASWLRMALASPAAVDASVMARSFALLFGSGATLVLLTVPAGAAGDRHLLGVLGPPLVAYCVSAGLLLRPAAAPMWLLKVLPIFGALLASVVVYSGGTFSAGAYALFYFWVIVFSFHFFERSWASLVLAVVAAQYGIVLLIAAHPRPGLFWLMATGTLGVAGYLLSSLREGQRRSQEAKEEAEASFERTFEDAGVGMAVASFDGVWLRVNRALGELLGYDPHELAMRRFVDFTHPEDVPADLRALAELAGRTRRSYAAEKRYLRSDGGVVWALLNVSRVDDRCGRPLHLIAQMQDITKRKQAERRLEHEALHDPLTGLANRTLLLDRLELALARAERGSGALALLFIDLDRFKRINDALGHAGGDELLLEVGHRLRSVVRPSDTVARFAGDAFTVLCEDLGDSHQALVVAKRVEGVLAEPFKVDGRTLFLTASIGVALARRPGIAADELLRRADQGMYRAKQAGRARYELLDATADPAVSAGSP